MKLREGRFSRVCLSFCPRWSLYDHLPMMHWTSLYRHSLLMTSGGKWAVHILLQCFLVLWRIWSLQNSIYSSKSHFIGRIARMDRSIINKATKATNFLNSFGYLVTPSGTVVNSYIQKLGRGGQETRNMYIPLTIISGTILTGLSWSSWFTWIRH